MELGNPWGFREGGEVGKVCAVGKDDLRLEA